MSRRAWVLYDVANSAFYLSIAAAIFPLFFQELYVRRHAGEGLPGELRTQGAGLLGYTAAAALLVIALLGPLLGALADRRGLKKRLLAGFALLGIVSTAGLAFVGPDAVETAALLYALGTVGAAGSIVFYDALLSAVAEPGDLDRTSSLGFAAGYFGSVLLFLVQMGFILKPSWFGLSGADAGVRLSFLSVAVWWGLFTIPLLRHVQEPVGDGAREGLGRTLRRLAGQKPLLLFLAAYWLYADGIGTIIKMAAAFGYSLGLERGHLLGALVLTQLIGVPCAFGFGRLARAWGPKRTILLGLAVYTLICGMALGMSRTWHFYALACGVGLVQGGTQALSRSLFATLIPAGRSAEYFGLFSTMEKFAGIAGPLILGLLWSGGGDPRRGIAAIAGFFLLGGLLLLAVDVEEGRRQASGVPAGRR